MSSRNDELQIDVDQSFQHKEWFVQRVGWAIWGVVIAAAMAGLLGSGPMSHTKTVADDGSLSVTYDRFLHYHNPTQLTIAPGDSTEAELQIKVSQQLLAKMQIERIEPEPVRTEIANDGVIYTFLQSPPLGEATLTFHVDYERFGKSRGTIQIVGHPPVVLEQFVYP